MVLTLLQNEIERHTFRISKVEYIKLFWKHELNDEPAIILYEVDTNDERLALRSVDILKDGNTQNIDNIYDGAIEITPIPTVEELNSHIWGEEFYASLISRDEFEKIWDKNRGK